MGLSGSKTKTSSTSTGTATTTPQAPSWIQQPAANYFGQIGTLLNENPQGISNPASALQNQAFASASNLGGFNQALADAMGGTRGLMNYTPQNVSAGQLSQTDLNPYMNPYTQNVIDAGVGDLERARQGIISNTQGRATQAGAYGGSRHGVADSETNTGYLRDVGSLVANLRNQNFNQAVGQAQFDIGNRLGADQFNVNSGLQGAQFRGNMASQLASQGLTNDANNRANLGLQAELGAQQRDIANQNDPTQQRLMYLAQLGQLMGINPSNFIGQQVNSSGQQTGTTTTNPGLGQILQSAAQAAAMIYASDRRLKREIEPTGEHINGTPLYTFAYLWDEPGVKRTGVMADEAPAHAVHVMDNGYLAVNYSVL